MSVKPTLSKPIGGEDASSPVVVARRLWPYLKPLLWVMVAGVLAMAVVAATEAGIPALLKPLLDRGFGTKGDVTAKLYVPIAVVGLALVRAAAQYASNYLLQYVSNRILLDLRIEMFNRMIHTGVSFSSARPRVR